MDMLDVVLETICELFTTIIRAIYNSLETVANMILYVFLPYSMFYIGQYFYSLENKFITIDLILLLPIITYIIVYIIKGILKKTGNSKSTMPIPKHRFTVLIDDDEVVIKKGMLNELILYVYDLEEWLERKGKINH